MKLAQFGSRDFLKAIRPFVGLFVVLLLFAMDAELRSLHNVCDIHGQNNAYKSQVKLHRGFCGHILAILSHEMCKSMYSIC